jgi:hypothetical protein
LPEIRERLINRINSPSNAKRKNIRLLQNMTPVVNEDERFEEESG